MHLTAAATLLFLGKALASPVDIEERQTSCPNIHVFGARETTAPVGYGTAGGKSPRKSNGRLNAHIVPSCRQPDSQRTPRSHCRGNRLPSMRWTSFMWRSELRQLRIGRDESCGCCRKCFQHQVPRYSLGARWILSGMFFDIHLSSLSLD